MTCGSLLSMVRSFLPLARILVVVPCVASALLGCGGAGPSPAPAQPPDPSAAASAAPPAGAPEAAAKTDEAPAAPADPNAIPTKCAENQAEGICAPPRDFVRTLCDQ